MKVLVIGDIMLDHTIRGKEYRMSPEGPFVVLKADSHFHSLGGAGNVAKNVKSITKEEVHLAGFIGKDSGGKKITELLTDSKIESNLVQLESCKTIIKTRLFANKHQILRFDEDDNYQGNPLPLPDLKNVEIIVISDYNKGTIGKTLIADLQLKYKCKIIVDPKGNDWKKYENSYLLTPNNEEIKQIIGNYENDSELIQLVRKEIISKFNIEYVVVTRSEDGLIVITKSNFKNIECKAVEVNDVCGAGDTVIATIGSFLNSYGATTAAEIANIAAGLVVKKMGTSSVIRDELLASARHLLTREIQ